MKIIITSVLGILLAACTNKALNSTVISTDSTDHHTGTAKAFSYLALGDSYTIGESVKQDESFPYQLKESLKKSAIVVSDLKMIARTGWTTAELKRAIDQEYLTKKFDLVTLLIGVNNQYRGYSPEAYRKEFIDLLNTSIAFAGGDKAKVFVLSIPDWGITPFGGSGKNKIISDQIDTFNAINKEETLNIGVSYIDITAISRKAINDTSLTSIDGLHPSAKMYELWVNALIPSVLKIP